MCINWYGPVFGVGDRPQLVTMRISSLGHLHSLPAGLPQVPNPTLCGNASSPAASATVRLWHEASPGAHVLRLRVSSPCWSRAPQAVVLLWSQGLVQRSETARPPALPHLVPRVRTHVQDAAGLRKGAGDIPNRRPLTPGSYTSAHVMAT